MAQAFTVYLDSLDIRLNNKQGHYWDCGDIPIATYNEQTKEFVPVVNNRGHGYASRNNQKFRKNKRIMINHG